LGLTSLKNDNEYGYSLSLWAWEVSMLEMAQAYSALSQLWKSTEINPILELKDKNGNILYLELLILCGIFFQILQICHEVGSDIILSKV
jgi:membrane carboxypeptidase/penicillin-binding protein